MHYIFDFNYLPGGEVYKHAVRLLLSQFEDVLTPKAYKYVTDNYIIEDKPEKLGGRAVGRQGMVGSNQGGERSCGWWKNTFYGLMKGTKKEDIGNPLHFLEAMAIHLAGRGDPCYEFVCSPIIDNDGFDIITKLSNWDQTKLDGKVFQDFAYMQCFVDDKAVNLADVVGKHNKTYTAVFPSATNLYTEVRRLKKEVVDDNELASFQEQNMTQNKVDVTSKDPVYWRKVTKDLTSTERAHLYLRMEEKFREHTVEPKVLEGGRKESLREYIDRFGQRLAADSKEVLLKPEKAAPNTKSKGGRPSTMKEKQRLKEEQDKWQQGEGGGLEGKDKNEKAEMKLDGGEGKNEKADINAEPDERWTVNLGEDPTLNDIIDHLDWLYGLDKTEKASMKMVSKADVVQLDRQMGHWTTIIVDAWEGKVTCNCEKCSRDGRCQWVNAFEAIEFGLEPDLSEMKSNEALVGFQKRVAQAVEIIQHCNVRPSTLKKA